MSFSRDFIRNLPGLDPDFAAKLDGPVNAPSVPPPAPECSEKEFQARVIAYAQERGWLVWHCYNSRRSAAGFLDLCMVRMQSDGRTGIHFGRVIFAELKTETGKESKSQTEWRKALEAIGGTVEAYLWRPSDWAKIEEILK